MDPIGPINSPDLTTGLQPGPVNKLYGHPVSAMIDSQSLAGKINGEIGAKS